MPIIQSRPRTRQLELSVSKDSTVPVYEQIIRIIQQAIADGTLLPGDALPPLRTVAQIVGVNQMTVSKAYKLLALQGWVRGQSGAGTLVLKQALKPAAANTAASGSTPQREPRHDGVLQSMAELCAAPGVISFTDAYPPFTPKRVDAFRSCIDRAMAALGTHAFRYGAPGGLPGLREWLSRTVSDHAGPTPPSQLVITSGAQQALDICVRQVFPRGGTIIVESPCYFGALDLFRSMGLTVVELPVSSQGVEPEAFEAACNAHPVTAFYTIPTVHNPTGITTPLARRRRLLALAQRHGVSIIEDDYCPEFLYSGVPEPSYRKLACEECPNVNVFYLRSLGKAYLPGIRLGFLISPASALNSVIAIKRSTDLHGPLLLQAAAEHYLHDAESNNELQLDIDDIQHRATKMFDVLHRTLPNGCAVKMISGGLSFWISFLKPVPDETLYRAAARHSVGFALGSTFVCSGRGESPGIRVSFGRLSEDDIREGARRLARALSDAIFPLEQPMDFAI